ncbi:MAG: sigma-70 family RNA polymerase sigma factor [Planctomycetota bacterium]
MTAPLHVDALLAETRWLSGLARQLVGSGADADDLVQETLRSAWERPPASARSPRAWLRAVMQSRGLDARRARLARIRRERAAWREVAAPSTLDVVAKAELHRRLVRLVMALEEPHRTCLLLRFFEDLPPRAIARRLGVPVATVHSRLQRALARVRARWTEANGTGGLLALLPLLPRRGPILLPMGVTLVNATAKLALVAVVVALAALVWSWSTSAPPAAVGPSARAAASSPAAAGDPVAAAGPAVVDLQRTEVAPPSAAAAPEEPSAPAALRGRVVDVHGIGLGGVGLALGGADPDAAPVARSDAGGAFELPMPVAADTVVAADPRWATVLAGSTRVQRGNPSTVVVAPRIALAGRVVDGDGRPLPGAAVAVHLPQHLGADLDLLLDFSVSVAWRATCAADGRFRLRDVPAVAAGQLSATLGGYTPRFVALPAATTELVELVLDRPQGSSTLVEGVVVDVWGAAVAGARVGAGGAVARSDARGAFTLDLQGRHLDRITAVAKGMQPAVFEPERGADGAAVWPQRVLLRLGPPPRSITGRVVDAAGAPTPGAKVWIADPLVVGVDGDAVLAESLLARPDDAGRPFWAFAVADAAGAFRIDGLRDRAYELRALDPATLLAVTRPGVAAGSDGVELQLAGATWPELRGRVVAHDGTPIADVQVKLQRPALEVQVPGGTRDEWAVGAAVRTGADGAFAFRLVPTAGVEVFALGDCIQFAGAMLTPEVDPVAFTLVVDRRVHLQVEVAPPADRVDRVQVLDADGRPMLLRVMRGQTAHTGRSAAVLDGRTEVLSLGEGAAAAVFLRDDREVGRLPVQLRIGQVNRLRY